MRAFRIALAGALLFPALALPAGRWRPFTATAYAIRGETADGHHTREGRTVAADESVLPFGTRIQIRHAGAYSGIYTVQDSGQKVNGREIDIFIADPGEAKRFGNRPVQVRVVRQAPHSVSSK